MAVNTKGFHHHNIRKRIHQKYETYPHPDKFKRVLDKTIYIIGIIGPIMTIPQLIKIWVEKNASGVSAISWCAYLITAIFWLIYGIAHKEKPIIFTNILWIILEAIIIVGTIIYG